MFDSTFSSQIPCFIEVPVEKWMTNLLDEKWFPHLHSLKLDVNTTNIEELDLIKPLLTYLDPNVMKTLSLAINGINFYNEKEQTIEILNLIS